MASQPYPTHSARRCMASVVLSFAPVDKGGSQLRDSRGLSPHSLLIAQLPGRVFQVGALRTVASAKLKNNIEKIKKYSEILDIACARLYLCKRDPEHNTKVNINQILKKERKTHYGSKLQNLSEHSKKRNKGSLLCTHRLSRDRRKFSAALV